MAVIYWSADGVGDHVGAVHTAFMRWIRTQPAPAVVVNGGDVYDDGQAAQFAKFLQQMDGDLSALCETPGNHDWRTRVASPATGEIPAGYDAFWAQHPPPHSRQPIDATKRSGARYEHFIDVDGWRLAVAGI